MNLLIANTPIGGIIAKVEAGERLSFEDGVRLFESDDIAAIGWAADLVRRRLNGDRTYYVVNRHINYTDVCKNRCRFCAFSRSEGDEGAYTMSVDEVVREAGELYRDLGFTELHIVGGLHPTLPFDYYTEMLSALKQRFPEVHLQAFTAVEIAHIAQIGGFTVDECLARLKEAGLGSIPGGGAEIFEPRVREQICPEKMTGEEWLSVMRAAHRQGIKSNATMLYGHVESAEDRVNHLLRLRELQDETGGFMSFIPLRFHPENTRLAHLARPRSGMDDLKMIAVGRLMLDNFPHIKVFWIMFGLKLAQVALSFGADDFDGTVVEEKITHRAGAETPEGLTVREIRRLIEETGTAPVERDTIYREVRRGRGPGAGGQGSEVMGHGSWVMGNAECGVRNGETGARGQGPGVGGHGSWVMGHGERPRSSRQSGISDQRSAVNNSHAPCPMPHDLVSRPVRLGCLPYLNVKPLVYPFEHGRLPQGWELVYGTPSMLAEMLTDGRIDGAPVSSFACLANQGLVIAPDICIASDGPVRSVLMLSKVEPAAIRTVALDRSSLTGAVMLRIVLEESYGVRPDFAWREPDIGAMLSEHDGALVIGNAAMLYDKTGLHVLDLGAEWKKLTGLPAVFALWAGRKESMTAELVKALGAAKEEGTKRASEIALEESRRLGLPLEVCEDYLTKVMRYDLGPREIESLQVFGEKAIRHGLIQERGGLGQVEMASIGAR
jgi:aminodeoxyfutalosine synthase